MLISAEQEVYPGPDCSTLVVLWLSLFCLFLAVAWVGLRVVIVAFFGSSHLLIQPTIQIWFLSHMPNAKVDVHLSSGAKRLKFSQSFYILPYAAHACNKGSGESTLMRRLARAFVDRLNYTQKNN